MIEFLKKHTVFIAAAAIAFIAALGIAFQNVTAFAEFLVNTLNLAFEYALPIAIVSGGIFSGGANFFLNVPLLESIFDRLRKRIPRPHLLTWDKKLEYFGGLGVFLVTGLLFGLAAISVGATGGLAIVALIAGVFVVLVTIPQELETWLERFDDPLTVALQKRIYDLEHQEKWSQKELSELVDGVDGLKLNLKSILITEKLKDLKEKYAEDEKGIAKTIDNFILHLGKHPDDLGELISKCETSMPKFARELEGIKGESEQYVLPFKEKFDPHISESNELIKEFSSEAALLDTLKNLKAQRDKALMEEAEKESAFLDLCLSALKKWWRDLTLGRFIGLLICLGNVIALSVLFTIGLAGFFISLGMGALPALIVGFVVAFTFGAFTEFYFYHYFLADFCDHFVYKWQELINSSNWGFGLVQVIVNAAVNGVLGYTGVALLTVLLTAAGITAPPLLALAIVVGVFAGLASLLLCSDFWIKSADRFFTLGGKEENKPSDIEDNNLDTTSLVSNDAEKLPMLKETVSKAISRETLDYLFSPVSEKANCFDFFPSSSAYKYEIL